MTSLNTSVYMFPSVKILNKQLPLHWNMYMDWVFKVTWVENKKLKVEKKTKQFAQILQSVMFC